MFEAKENQLIVATVMMMLFFCYVQLVSSYHKEMNIMNDVRINKRYIIENADNKTFSKILKYNDDMNVNPEELGKFLEGDIVINSNSYRRNGNKDISSKWPGGVVPYLISPIFDEKQQRLIREAMSDFHQNTCIKFKPYNGDESDYIRLTSANTGCWSIVGRAGGHQDVNLEIPGCVSKKGTIIHELMHALGFYHEQSRPERDEYVEIRWRNIQTGLEGNFKKHDTHVDYYGVKYDYGSIMHYSENAFSRNGFPTIVARDMSAPKLGQRKGLSSKDIQKIRRMYKCNERKRRF